MFRTHEPPRVALEGLFKQRHSSNCRQLQAETPARRPCRGYVLTASLFYLVRCENASDATEGPGKRFFSDEEEFCEITF